MQSIVPLTGDKFIGQPGADVNGSKLVRIWVKAGGYWFSSGNPDLTEPFNRGISNGVRIRQQAALIPSVTGNSITSNCAGITLGGYQRNEYIVPLDNVVTDNSITYFGSSVIRTG